MPCIFKLENEIKGDGGKKKKMRSQNFFQVCFIKKKHSVVTIESSIVLSHSTSKEVGFKYTF